MRLQIKECVEVTAEWLFEYEDIHTGRKWTEGPYKNKVVVGGLNNLAALLIGENPSNTAATHLVIGSSTVAVQSDDDLTDMGETFRKAITQKTRQGAMARMRTFLLSGEGNGDHKCAGIVARGTGDAGTGDLLNRLVQPFSKTSSINLTIEVRWNHQGVSV